MKKVLNAVILFLNRFVEISGGVISFGIKAIGLSGGFLLMMLIAHPIPIDSLRPEGADLQTFYAALSIDLFLLGAAGLLINKFIAWLTRRESKLVDPELDGV